VLHSLKQRGAVFGTLFAFLCFAAIYFPNTLMVRPHPIFWRLVLGAMVAYGMFLTYLLLLPIDEARTTLKYFDDRLG
jgi:phosphatidylserine synthase 2